MRITITRPQRPPWAWAWAPTGRTRATGRWGVLALAAMLTAGQALAETCLEEPTAPTAVALEGNLEPIFEPFVGVVRQALQRRDSAAGVASAPPSPQGAMRPDEAVWRAGLGTALLRPMAGEGAGAARGSVEASAWVSRTLSDGGLAAHRHDMRRHLAQAEAMTGQSMDVRAAAQAASLLLDRERHRQKVIIGTRWLRQLACARQALQAAGAQDAQAMAIWQAGQAHALALRDEANLALRETSRQLRHVLGDGLPLTAGLPPELMRAALGRMPTMEAATAADIASLRAQEAAARAQRLAEEASWAPRVEGFAGTRAASSPWAGTSGHLSLMIGLNVDFDLDAEGRQRALAEADRRVQARSAELKDSVDLRRRALDERRAAARQAMERARRIAGLLRDGQSLAAMTLQDWRAASAASAAAGLRSMRAHFELQGSYVDALHEAQTSVVDVMAASGQMQDWIR